jgi:hypothetical protein
VDDPKKILTFALEKYPEQVEVVPMAERVIDSARQNPKRPAYVKLAMPDQVVKSLRGGRRGGSITLVVHVPEEVTERSESRIILPGEVR